MGRINEDKDLADPMMEDSHTPRMTQDEIDASPDSPVVSNVSHVFWRTETSLSDDEDDKISREEDRSAVIIAPDSGNAKALRQRNDKLSEDVPAKSYALVSSNDKKEADVYVDVDLEKYMASREMSPLQERANAVTMIPPVVMCVVFILSGAWINKHLLEEAKQDLDMANMSPEEALTAFEANSTCMDWSNLPLLGWAFQHLHAVPPLPLIATIMGIILHAPWSFTYHWKYAHTLSPTKRTDHWSRRMDQAVLHVSSAMTSYGNCGYFGNYMALTVLFAADSFYRQFEPKVQPKRNQNRLGAAILAWTLPVLRRGDLDMFFQLLLCLSIGIFLFVRYPIGGWSHAAFHLMLIPLTHLLLGIGSTLPASQDHMKVAAQCYAMAELRNQF